MFLTTWWWAAPTAAGLGAIGYAGLTTGRRRSRRLAVDAARHEERAAVQRLLQAQADSRAAQAQVLSAQAAQRGRFLAAGPAVSEARRELQRARQAQRAASLALKASRAQVRAERARMHATGDLPLARLLREHDELLARWLEYETDLETSLAFPQMTDPHHPATAAFLHAQRDAGRLRPASASTRMTPEDFVAYRAAVHAAVLAFDTAEDAALRASASRGTLPSAPPAPQPRPAMPDTARPPDAAHPRVWPVPRRNPPPPTAP